MINTTKFNEWLKERGISLAEYYGIMDSSSQDELLHEFMEESEED